MWLFKFRFDLIHPSSIEEAAVDIQEKTCKMTVLLGKARAYF